MRRTIMRKLMRRRIMRRVTQSIKNLCVILSGAAAVRSAAAAESKDPYFPTKIWPSVLISFAIAILLATLPCAAAAQDHPIALKGGKLQTVTHGVIENGVVVMQGGKITAVGPAGSTNILNEAQVIDATGMTIYPGLIDSETSLGLTEISSEASTNDLVELSDEIMPHMHTADAFHAESALIPVARL